MSDAMQIALPLLHGGDLSNNGWTPPPVSGTLRGGGSVTAAVPPGGSFVVQLDGLAWPTDQGARHLTVSLAPQGSDDVPVTVALLQGGGVVAARRALPPTYKEADFDLTAAEVKAITDYSQLSVQVTAGDVLVSCCPNALPPVLYGTISDLGGAGCLAGTYALTNNGGNAWQGQYTVCGGHTLSIDLVCSGGHWGMVMACGTGPGAEVYGTTGPTSSSCSPLRLTFPSATAAPDNQCCPNGTVALTVTQ